MPAGSGLCCDDFSPKSIASKVTAERFNLQQTRVKVNP
jgi:hypothetical protein